MHNNTRDTDGEKKYYYVYFDIKTKGMRGGGWASDEDRDAYHAAMSKSFTEAGWEVVPGDSPARAAKANKGRSSLYLHPICASGVIEYVHVSEIENIYNHCEIVEKLYSVKYAREVYDLTDEDYKRYLESKRNQIEADLLCGFKTTRANSYHYDSDSVLGAVRDLHHISRIQGPQCVKSSTDIEWVYVDKVFAYLVDLGYIVTTTTKKGTGYRTSDDGNQRVYDLIDIIETHKEAERSCYYCEHLILSGLSCRCEKGIRCGKVCENYSENRDRLSSMVEFELERKDSGLLSED